MGFIQSAINKTLGTVGVAGSIASKLTQSLEDRQTQAMKKVAEQQAAQKKQKRNFMDYLKKQPTSFGGSVGDLPLAAQKTLAKQYSKTDRQKLMNQMDKESNKKK